ncbi:MAG: DUF4357 domain-containing protein [Clostridia bacterium]|jgi:hypothetical protein|nr:DUF4357 domain-containing protein [Clostridia bacterium]
MDFVYASKNLMVNFRARFTYVDDHTFVLRKGSTVNPVVSRRFKSWATVLQRRGRAGIDPGNLTLKEDIVFTSATQAGEFVCGHACQGPLCWIGDDGRSFKEWRASLGVPDETEDSAGSGDGENRE